MYLGRGGINNFDLTVSTHFDAILYLNINIWTMTPRKDAINYAINVFGGKAFLSNELPSAASIYYRAHESYLMNDLETAKSLENLIHILHNCHIPAQTEIGKGLNIAYKGIGVLVHKDSKIGNYVTLGTNVTLGAAPVLQDHVYISTGARVIGSRVTIGPFSIVGANAVVKESVPPLTIVAGVPSKVIRRITEDNLEKYLELFCAGQKNIPALVDEVRCKAKRLIGQVDGPS